MPDTMIASLLSDIQNKKHVHAYIFEGGEGLGKRGAAAQFAAALLCGSASERPCGKCESCIQAYSGNNPDIKRLTLSDLSSRKSIGADDIRRIISDCYIRPFSSAYKVYIIEDGDALTPQAQNAMLKVLEEPPSYVVFIICTGNIGFILPTVQSRSRIVRFSPQSDEEIRQYILRTYPDMAQSATLIAALSHGVPGRADALCGDGSVLALRSEAVEMLEQLLCGDDERCMFRAADFFEQNGKSGAGGVPLILDFMLSALNDMLKLKSGVTAGLSNGDLAARLANIASRCTAPHIAFSIDRIVTAEQMLQRYVPLRSMALWLAAGLQSA